MKILGSRETIKEKMNVVMKSMEILSGLNMWASGNRISKLPPSKVDKIEVTFVQQNYLLLSKVCAYPPPLFHPFTVSLFPSFPLSPFPSPSLLSLFHLLHSLLHPFTVSLFPSFTVSLPLSPFPLSLFRSFPSSTPFLSINEIQ